MVPRFPNRTDATHGGGARPAADRIAPILSYLPLAAAIKFAARLPLERYMTGLVPTH